MWHNFTSRIHATLDIWPQCSFAELNRETLAGGQMKHMLKKFWSDQSGATAIEYGLIAAGISLVIIVAVNGIGGKLNTSFSALETSLK